MPRVQGFTTRHWIGTAGVVTVMVLAAAGCWAAIQVSCRPICTIVPTVVLSSLSAILFWENAWLADFFYLCILF
jgi:hypothetical protein